MNITSDVIQNSYFKSLLQLAEENIKKGEPISSVFVHHDDLYPAFVGEMMSIGERQGNLGEMLSNVATFMKMK